VITDPNRFGVYRTAGLDYVNKGDALTVATLMNTPVSWHFNDEIYSSFDWRVPIDTPLTELYRQRAQQLRDQYDYVSLFFSGGVDSANILHAFIDNGILLDEVVMFKPFSQETNDQDHDPRNLYGEIDHAAIPHLKQYINDPRTTVRMIDMEASTKHYLNNSHLLDQFNRVSCFGSASVARAGATFTDAVWRGLYEQGKNVAHVQGIDKPVIQYINGEYVFAFDESATISSQFDPGSRTAETEMITKHHHHEFFYWTPNLPQLVIKQCQVVKQLCMNSLVHRLLFSMSELPMQDRIMRLIHEIYPAHVNAIRNRFCTRKQSSAGLLASHHQWIYRYTDPNTQGAWRDIITNLQTTIDDRFFVQDKSWWYDANSAPAQKTVQPIKKFQYKFFTSRRYQL